MHHLKSRSKRSIFYGSVLISVKSGWTLNWLIFGEAVEFYCDRYLWFLTKVSEASWGLHQYQWEQGLPTFKPYPGASVQSVQAVTFAVGIGTGLPQVLLWVCGIGFASGHMFTDDWPAVCRSRFVRKRYRTWINGFPEPPATNLLPHGFNNSQRCRVESRMQHQTIALSTCEISDLIVRDHRLRLVLT